MAVKTDDCCFGFACASSHTRRPREREVDEVYHDFRGFGHRQERRLCAGALPWELRGHRLAPAPQQGRGPGADAARGGAEAEGVVAPGGAAGFRTCRIVKRGPRHSCTCASHARTCAICRGCTAMLSSDRVHRAPPGSWRCAGLTYHATLIGLAGESGAICWLRA